MSEEPRPFGLYIHWPFCLSKCPYCDFNSHVRSAIDPDDWVEGLLSAIDRLAQRIGKRRLDSVFFGGGTPSLMPACGVAALIARANRHWPLQSQAEITLEANPGSVDVSRFVEYRAAGVNRISLGVQSLCDEALSFLGRGHNRQEALTALASVNRLFERWSFDLIYARSGQSIDGWRAELREALSFNPRHLCLYQLTVEPGTAFHAAFQRGASIALDEERAGAMFEMTQEEMDKAALPAYEISNHACLGQESRHNSIYWHYDDYAGVGPGAHGRLTLANGQRLATVQHRSPERWLADLRQGGDGMASCEIVEAQEKRFEVTMMGLRLTGGIARQRFLRDLGTQPESLFERQRLDALIEGGYLLLDEHGLRATRSGLQRLNSILSYLL